MKIKNTITLVFFIVFININGVYGQLDCATNNKHQVNYLKYYEYCNEPDNYLANYLLDKNGVDKYGHSPIYTVNVKVHVIQYSSEEPINLTEQDTSYIRQTIEAVNEKFKNLNTPSIPIISDPLLEETDKMIRKRMVTDFQEHFNNTEIPELARILLKDLIKWL